MKLTFCALLLITLCGCASRPLKTESGFPEVDIKNSTTDAIAQEVRRQFGMRGYRYLRWESGLVFEKGLGEVAEEIYGGADVPSRLELRVLIYSLEQGGHKVVATGTIITQFGAIAQRTAADNQGNRDLQKILKELKKEIEG